MKKLLPLLAVIFGIVFIGNMVDNDSDTNNKSNYTVIDSSDEEDFASETDSPSISAIALTDEPESIDELVSVSQDAVSKDSTGNLSQTELEATEKLKQAKSEALAEYERAIAEAESEYEKTVTNSSGEKSDTSASMAVESDKKNINDKDEDITEVEAESNVETDKAKDKTDSEKAIEEEQQDEVEKDNTTDKKSTETEVVKEETKADNNSKYTTEEKSESVQKSESNEIEVKENSDEQESDGMVWIPQSGKKYHKNKDCSNMKEPTKVTKDSAVSRGYTPCKKCYKN